MNNDELCPNSIAERNYDGGGDGEQQLIELQAWADEIKLRERFIQDFIHIESGIFGKGGVLYDREAELNVFESFRQAMQNRNADKAGKLNNFYDALEKIAGEYADTELREAMNHHYDDDCWTALKNLHDTLQPLRKK
jgi:hypothetical protein